MSENKSLGSQNNGGGQRNTDTICIDTYRVLDSCRDRDCYEDVRVFLDANGQSIIDRTCTIRTTNARTVWVYIGLEEIPFNECFFQLNLRYYLYLTFEACLGGRSYTFNGAAVVEKKVVLWGGEGNLTVFRSNDGGTFCNAATTASSNLPVGVVETVAPIVLSSKILDCNTECGCCCVSCDELPEAITCLFEDGLVDPEEGNRLYATFGIFSVVRIERPAQYLISASEYAVPDKECTASDENDPCSLFRSMAFPVDEFSSSCCGTSALGRGRGDGNNGNNGPRCCK